MKIIFLDFDGVIVTRKYRCRKADEACVKQLNKLTDSLDCQIVVSSCWRIGKTVDELRKLVESWGITGRILDRTPLDWSLHRGQEIQLWIDEFKNSGEKLESFVIIDDDSDMDHLLPFLVKTVFDDGLTAEKVKEALVHLRKI